jgi:hypothetical protein
LVGQDRYDVFIVSHGRCTICGERLKYDKMSWIDVADFYINKDNYEHLGAGFYIL